MKKHQDITKVEWLLNHYDLDKAAYVHGVLPDSFEVYLKIFMPFGISKNVSPKKNSGIDLKLYIKKFFAYFNKDSEETTKQQLEEKSWEQIAKLFNVNFDKQFSSNYIKNSLPLGIHKLFAAELRNLKLLIDILGPKQKSIVFWSGDPRTWHVNDIISKEYNQSCTIDLLNLEFTELFKLWNQKNQETYHFYPMFWVDGDKQWCFGSLQIETEFWLLGCSEKTASQIDKCPEIESLRLNYNDQYVNWKND